MRKERAYLASLLQKFHHHLFPQEVLLKYLRETLPAESVDRLQAFFSKAELAGDSVLIGLLSEKMLEGINEASNPDSINASIVEFLK